MTLQTPANSTDTTPRDARSARVWILQPTIEHYRTAIFDGLNERGAADGAYQIQVLGTLKDGKAIGGSARPYFISCTRIPFRIGPILFFKAPEAVRLFNESKPDLLITEAHIRNVTVWKMASLCRKTGTPVIGWSKIHSYSKAAGFISPLKKLFYSKFDRMICYGDSSKAELVAMGYPADRAIVANNTIDTRKIFTQGDQLRARGEEIRKERNLVGKKILLCIGRMEIDKRHTDLLDAWPKLKALDENLVMVLISGGPMLDEIKSKAAALDPQRIIVTGRVPEGDDYAWIATSDVSVYPGAVGLAINQSLAFGKPTVIADEVGADSEILVGAAGGDKQTGWRYERGNLDAMVSTIATILKGSEEVRRVGERGHVLMRDKVTLDNMIGAIDRSIRLGLALRRTS